MSRRTATRSATRFTHDDLTPLLEAAARFVSPDRANAMLRKWLRPNAAEGTSEYRKNCMAEDASNFGMDLLVCQPSGSGATAFDRLARHHVPATEAERAALTALCAARFRLLRLDRQSPTGHATVQDVVSGEALDLLPAELPPMKPGTMLFARVAMLGTSSACPAGLVTPLDETAADVARRHPAAGKPGALSGARWAEALYGHIVRCGTLDVPGLNRPGIDKNDELLNVGLAWTALAEAPPDPALLDRTRCLVGVPALIDGLGAMILAGAAGEAALSAGFQRLLVVLVETVLRRERIGCGALTMAIVQQALEVRIEGGRMPVEARVRLESLRQMALLGAAAPAIDDTALATVMQRIRGLRAKTVAQGCTEQEALAAAEKVAELLDRHGLSLGEAEFDAQPCGGIAVQTERRRLAALDECVPAVADFFGCRVWVEQGSGEPLRYILFGLHADVAAAHSLYDMVERAFETETDTFRGGDLYASMEGERRSATNSFQLGLATGICRKLRALQHARHQHLRSASGRDLVSVKAALVEDELAKLGLQMHTRNTPGGKRVLSDAYDAGQQAGARFEVMPGLSHAA